MPRSKIAGDLLSVEHKKTVSIVSVERIEQYAPKVLATVSLKKYDLGLFFVHQLSQLGWVECTIGDTIVFRPPTNDKKQKDTKK